MNHVEYRPALPDAWRWQPIDSLASVKVSTVDKKSYEDELPVSLCNYTDVYYNDEITGTLDFMRATASCSQVANFTVRAGDVVITKDSETSDDIGRPAYVPGDLPGVVYGYHLAIYRPFDLRYGKFLRYLFDSTWVRAELRSRTPGVTRVGLNQETLRHLRIPVPSALEARKIADYLDRETAEIDAFVADLENLKTLTTERVLALLEHELWGNADEVAPLRRFLLGVDQGVSPEADSSPAGPGEVGVLKAGCTNNGRFDVWANKRLDSSDQFTASMFVAEGDLIVTRASGSLRHVGSAALVPCLDRKLAMSDKNYRLITDSRLEGEYLALVMQTNRWRIQLEPLVSGAQGLARNISVANLKTLEIPVVSRAKQEEIKENLREQIQKVGMASEDIDALISLGEEHRAALISAAVTGKINVTEQGASAAEQLRDELEVHV